MLLAEDNAAAIPFSCPFNIGCELAALLLAIKARSFNAIRLLRLIDRGGFMHAPTSCIE